MSVTVVIPSYNPDGRLPRLVQELSENGINDILIVDDGSLPSCGTFFEQAGAVSGVTVLHHEENRGKGRALKTAFAWLTENRPDGIGAITVDGDGQHAVADILHIAKALEQNPTKMYFGVRDFNASNVPGRSRFGNKLARCTMRWLCGVTLQDTQTGLRGIPSDYWSSFTKVPGERFEYETNMLLEMRRYRIPYEQITIETVYIDGNQSSHYRPIRDSIRVYWPMLMFFLRFTGSSLIAFAVDWVLFTFFINVCFDNLPYGVNIWCATAVARVFSSLVNFIINRRAVFRSTERLGGTLWRYYALCVCIMTASALLVTLMTGLFHLPEEIAKCIADVGLFFVNYSIQQRIFHRPLKEDKQ